MSSIPQSELVQLLAMSTAPDKKISTFKLIDDIRLSGGISAVWDQKFSTTLFEDEIGRKLLEDANDVISRSKTAGLRMLSCFDSDYPEQLATIHEMPAVIWIKGILKAETKALSVVGTRTPSEWALNYVADLIKGLRNSEVTVVSGLALGVDTCAHTEALKHGMRTVAVLGNGLDISYPPTNMNLQNKIVSEGMVLSQFPPGFSPTKFSFPMRNAVMSGYSRASLIVEAGENSGTRIQGRVAIAHGRSVILTQKVVDQTSWAKKLSKHPGVFVAQDVSEAISLALEYSQPVPQVVRELISQIV